MMGFPNIKGMDIEEHSRKMAVLTAGLYLICLFLMLLFGTRWSLFTVLYSVWFLSFVLLLYLILNTKLGLIFTDNKTYIACAFLFFLAFVIQSLFLLREPSLSQDIMRMVIRGNYILDGKTPYQDFVVNKPPLYIWMVGGISWLFGSSINSYRLVFIVFNSCIPVLMYIIGTTGKDNDNSNFKRNWSIGAFAYAVCPLTILEVGLAAHFDPVVVFFSLIAYLLFRSKKSFWSGFFLGICFSLKIYGIVILGILFLGTRRWKERIFLVIGFLLSSLISALPLLLIDPKLLADYFLSQTTDWYTTRGMKLMFEGILSMLGMSDGIASYLTLSVLILTSIMIILTLIRKKFGRRHGLIVLATGLPLVGMGILSYGGITIIGSDRWDHVLNTFVFSVVLILFLIMMLAIFRKWEPLSNVKNRKLDLNSMIPSGSIPIAITTLLFLLIMTSAQFHPWYLLWILPFIFATNKEWMWSMLVLFGIIHSLNYAPVDMIGF
jgi:hypothetical protein